MSWCFIIDRYEFIVSLCNRFVAVLLLVLECMRNYTVFVFTLYDYNPIRFASYVGCVFYVQHVIYKLLSCGNVYWAMVVEIFPFMTLWKRALFLIFFMTFSYIMNTFFNQMGWNFGKRVTEGNITLIPSDHGRLIMINILDHINDHMVIWQKH